MMAFRTISSSRGQKNGAKTVRVRETLRHRWEVEWLTAAKAEELRTRASLLDSTESIMFSLTFKAVAIESEDDEQTVGKLPNCLAFLQ